MFVRIPKLLNESNLQFMDELIASGSWVDGTTTAGEPTKAVKHNLQLDMAVHPKKDEFLRMVSGVMNEHRMVRSTVIPKRMTPPLVSKYQQGMAYGWHVDNALMQGMGSLVRTDVACTIFLSDMNSYDGGELQVRTPSGDVRVKLDKGDAIVYPAAHRHQVLEVTRGERLAIVFWIQSMIADMAKREILYDLEIAFDRIMSENPESEAGKAIQHAQANLVRHWTEV